MATNKNITMKQFNGTDYDTLYPKTKVEQVEGAYAQQQILSNTTAALYGLGADAVPDDVLALLSRFQSGLGNDYIWKKYHTTFDLGPAQAGINEYVARYYPSHSIYCGIRYATSAEDLFNGNYKQISASEAGSASKLATNINNSDIRGKYFYTYDEKTGEPDSDSTVSSGSIRLYPLDADAYSSDSTNVYLSSSYSQYPEAGYVPTDVSYVNSPDAATYPPSVDDGYKYAFLGQLGAKAQIETGYYVGTGTYGSDNPCSLTLPFPPKFGVIASRWSIGFYLSGSDSMWVMVYESSYNSSRHDVGSLTASEADSTVQWYTAGLITVNGSTSESALFQLNVSDETYDYCFFG